MLCAKFDGNCHSFWIGKKSFRQYFSIFCYYFLFEKGGSFKREFPSPNDALCHVCLKLVQRFWRRRRTCEKFTDRRTDRWMINKRRSEQLTWSFSSGAKKQVNLSLKSETCFHFFSYSAYKQKQSTLNRTVIFIFSTTLHRMSYYLIIR